MLAVGDRSLAGFGEEGAEHALPLDERRVGNAEAIEMEEVEGEVDEAVLPAVFEIFHQRPEIARPGRALHDHLAVEDDLVDRELSHGRRDAGETRRPVVAVPREQPRPAVSEMRLDAITVELDLVHPLPAGRRRVLQRRQAQLDEARHGGRPRPG